MTPVERQETRARAARAGAAVRAWQYRQRHLAAGTWFRLRRVLADARLAYAISDDDARRLLAEGLVATPSGRELVPERIIVFVDETRAAALASRQPVRVGLGPDLLGAVALALVAFDDAAPAASDQRTDRTNLASTK